MLLSACAVKNSHFRGELRHLKACGGRPRTGCHEPEEAKEISVPPHESIRPHNRQELAPVTSARAGRVRFGSRCPCGAVGPGVRYNRRAACEGTDSRLPNTLGSGGQGDRRRTASEHHSAGPSTHTWAFRSFRDVADGDYIAARMACRAQLSHQFLWASQQAIEKYLKSALFLRRIPAKKVRHDLAPALKLLTDAGVGFTLSERSQKFVDRVDQMGQFRYMEVSQWVDWHWIVPLDQVVWELRRFSTLDPMATNARLIEGKWAPRVKIVGGHLERILAKRDNPAREALLWHNGYFGRGRRTIMVRSGITAVNSPLLHTTELLDEILQYAYIPKDVVKAYKAQAAVKSKATKKR